MLPCWRFLARLYIVNSVKSVVDKILCVFPWTLFLNNKVQFTFKVHIQIDY